MTPVMTRDGRLEALQRRFPAWHVWYVDTTNSGTQWYARLRVSPVRGPDAHAASLGGLEQWLEVQDSARAQWRQVLYWADAQGVASGVPWFRGVQLW